MSIKNYIALTKAPKASSPLIFVFHGTGGDEHQFFDLAQSLVPDAGVISPRGDVSESGAARFFKRTGEGVYDMPDLAKRTTIMAAFIAAHIAQNPDAPVHGFGYSNGANILASVALDHPDLFDRIGLLHPLIPWAPAPVSALSGKRVLITAGQRDPICPLPESKRLIDWFAQQGSQVTTIIHAGGHNIDQSEIVALQKFLNDA